MSYPSAREIAMHEATHSAALCMAGMTPECVRVDWPDDETVGTVTIDWGERITPAKARHALIAVVLGAMTEGSDGWKRWPIDPDRLPASTRRDGEQAATLAGYLGFDHGDWLYLVWQANQLARTPEFRRLCVAIADELERVEVLDADDLRRIHEATREEPTWST